MADPKCKPIFADLKLWIRDDGSPKCQQTMPYGCPTVLCITQDICINAWPLIELDFFDADF
jgi:hypothetical protein